MIWRPLKTLLLVSLLGLSGSAGAVPYELTYQGRLVEPTGDPTPGPVQLKVEFFRSPDGDDPVGSALTFDGVALNDGVFQVNLIMTPSNFHAVFADSDKPVYIQVTDISHGRAFTRQKYNAVPYALKVPVDNATIGYTSDGLLTVLDAPSDTKVLWDTNSNGSVDAAEDSSKLEGKASSYFTSVDNHVSGSTNKLFTATDKTKLDGLTNALGGDLSGTVGTAVVTKVGTVSAANIAAGANLANGATSDATVSTLVKRDTGGDFSTRTVTLDGTLKLRDSDAGIGGNAFTTTLRASGTMAENWTYTLPAKSITGGKYLMTDDDGNLSWTTPAPGGGGAAGDMTKAAYDANDDGKVATAENAELLGGQAGTYYTNASNMALGTLSLARGGTGGTDAASARTSLGAAASGSNSDITALSGLSTALSVGQGGTGATNASTARTSLGAAASGANSDITALSGLSTALSVGQGGTGATNASTARTSLGAAASGANSDITALSGLSTALSVAQGGTGGTTASDARSALFAASRGANFDITSLSSLSSPLSVSQGGTGSINITSARTTLEAAKLGANSDITTLTAATSITGLQTLTFDGDAPRTISSGREPTTVDAGRSLTLQAGGAPSAQTNMAGGSLILSGGLATGNSTSTIELRTAGGGASGATDSTPSTKVTILGNGNVGIGSTTPGYPLTVAGVIQSTAGGIRFPDGSTKTSNKEGYILVLDEKTAGSHGGNATTTPTPWNIRELNVLKVDTDLIASLSGNVLTLPAGTYRCNGSAPGYQVASHQARLYNVTSGTVLGYGTSEQTSTGGTYASTRSHFNVRFTLAVTSGIRLEHRFEAAQGTNGLGNAVGFAGTTEVYSILECLRIY